MYNAPTLELPLEDLSSASCHGCRTYDASLRHSVHPVVVSTLTAARASSRIGIWCAKCRGLESAKAIAISLLAGWWSVRGPALTIEAIRTNLGGGRLPLRTNAQLLRGLAVVEYEARNPEMAAQFAAAAHSVQPQKENSWLMEELRRAGHRAASVPASPWRFAAWAPFVVLAIVLAGGFTAAFRGNPDGPGQPVVQAVRASAVPKPIPANQPDPRPRAIDPAASGDELQPLLATSPDPGLARAYFRTRLIEARSSIPLRVERGEDLLAVRNSIAALASEPGVAALLESPSLKNSYDKLNVALNEATTYYRGGAPVEAIQRTAGESVQVTGYIGLHAIDAELRGQAERAKALGDAFDPRAESLRQMQLELLMRQVIIATTTQAIDECLIYLTVAPES